MRHTFEENSLAYWLRAIVVVGLISAFALLPCLAPRASGSGGFALIVSLIGIVSLGFLIYARPRELTLVIDCQVVLITDRRKNVVVSKNLSEVAEVSLGRWGHVLKFPLGWIVLREMGHSKPRYFGAVSGKNLDADMILKISESLARAKKERDEEENGA